MKDEEVNKDEERAMGLVKKSLTALLDNLYNHGCGTSAFTAGRPNEEGEPDDPRAAIIMVVTGKYSDDDIKQMHHYFEGLVQDGNGKLPPPTIEKNNLLPGYPMGSDIDTDDTEKI